MYNVILDVDGTLLMWRDVFISWLKKHNLVDEVDPTDYNFSSIKIPGCENASIQANSEFRNMLSRLFNESYYLNRLPPIAGAVSVIRSLQNMGCRFTVVSSYTDNYEAMKSREENLVNVFGPIFEDIVSLPLHSSKTEWLSKQDKNSIFIEDSVAHIKDAISVGFDINNCFLIPHAYNYNDWLKTIINGERLQRMFWNEILTTIRGF